MHHGKPEETVPCKTCGEPTKFTGTKRCNNCYEVESRLDSYLRNPKALQLIVRKIRENELKQGAAEAIELFDEDELERYSDELKEAQQAVLDGHVEDIRGWVKMDEMDELKAFLNSALNLDRMTLSEIRARFESYLPELCPHGEPLGDCTACDVAGDLAYDAAREDRP